MSQPGKPAATLIWLEGSRFRVPGPSGIQLEFKGAPEVISLDLATGGHIIHLPKTK